MTKFSERKHREPKEWINAQLMRIYKRHKTIGRALFLEDSEMNTVKALRALGVTKMLIPNYSATICRSIRSAAREADVYEGSLFDCIGSAVGVFDFVFADYMTGPAGAVGCSAPIDDMQQCALENGYRLSPIDEKTYAPSMIVTTYLVEEGSAIKPVRTMPFREWRRQSLLCVIPEKTIGWAGTEFKGIPKSMRVLPVPLPEAMPGTMIVYKGRSHSEGATVPAWFVGVMTAHANARDGSWFAVK
ncbi:hypothetical protein JKP88DRAFT_272903 [Tribonema minus]|uniref:Uncharacterized protein n=1 Tax=Tribonema minus TaxID=303371 RepID=A0A835YWV3_9STRA|nr:hypothetical protein JKP88DRAFT_272903 [Tribonema minus]